MILTSPFRCASCSSTGSPGKALSTDRFMLRTARSLSIKASRARSVLPIAVSGMASSAHTKLGDIHMRGTMLFEMPADVSKLYRTPGSQVKPAATHSPQRGWGIAAAAAFCTPGMSLNMVSTSTKEIFSPPRFTMSEEPSSNPPVDRRNARTQGHRCGTSRRDRRHCDQSDHRGSDGRAPWIPRGQAVPPLSIDHLRKWASADQIAGLAGVPTEFSITSVGSLRRVIATNPSDMHRRADMVTPKAQRSALTVSGAVKAPPI